VSTTFREALVAALREYATDGKIPEEVVYDVVKKIWEEERGEIVPWITGGR